MKARLPVPLLLATLALLSALPPAAPASGVPVVDPLPWELLDLGRAAIFTAERLDDPDSGWRADRLGLSASLPFGAGHRLFLEWSHLGFDAGGLRVLDRWPELSGEEADPEWPGEDRASGWNRPGVGVVGVARLPLLGRTGFALAGRLPLGSDTLYPFSGRSLPLHFGLRRAIGGGAGWRAALRAGAVVHLDSPGDELSSEAFPTLTEFGGDVGWRGEDGRSLRLDLRVLDGGGGRTESVTLRGEIPAGGESRFFLALRRQLSGSGDRPWRDGVRLGWILFGAAPAPETPEPADGRRGREPSR